MNYMHDAMLKNGTRDSPSLREMILGSIKHVANMVIEWPDFEDISSKLHKIVEIFDDKVSDIVNAKNSKINVINHGDGWVSNILFYHDEAQVPIDMLFVSSVLFFLKLIKILTD